MGPLHGVRVIEFAGIGPAPFCGMVLADMGADVVVIDRKTGNPNAVAANVEPRFNIVNRGKRSIALDLKQKGARDAALELIAGADVLLEGYRPGVLERAGLGPADCHAVNAKLVFARLTGWGQHGPLAHSAGHDINYIALAGALYYGGRGDAPPIAPPTLVGDIGGGSMVMALGILAALLHARETGEGQVVDTSIVDGSAYGTSLLYGLYKQGLWSGNRYDNFLDGAAPWYDCYECADGHYVSIGSLEPNFYATLLDKLDLTDDDAFRKQFDKRAWPELKSRLAEIFKAKTREEWCELLEGTDVCFAPVLDFEEATSHPHNEARDTFIELDGVTQPAPAPRFSATPSEVSGPAPQQGQNSEEILQEAGLTQEQIAELREQAAI